jgi:hypothetical protein
VGRALTVARLRVAPARQAEYLAALAELEALGRARGRHLWVFRSGNDPDLFLEFSESGAGGGITAPSLQAAGREAVLEARLRELGARESSPDELWHELPLPAHAT